MSRSLRLGLSIAATGLALPAQAECLGSGCYDDLGLILAAAVIIALAVIALVIFVMVKMGLGWLIKWLIGAGILLTVVPPLVISAIHNRKLAKIDAMDVAGPLPRLADRTPLLVLYSADSQGCNYALDQYIEAKAFEGVLVLETWSTEDPVDFSQPVDLSRLPLVRKLAQVKTVTDDPNVAGSYEIKETVFQTLTPEDRELAAAEVDYLVFAQCYGTGDVFEAFRLNPALQGTDEPFLVELAMAPLEKGPGAVSIPDLTFDLLDLRYDGTTPGFLFARYQQGGEHKSPYEPAALEAAFCVERDGAETTDCDP
jgi:hypothetical protein